jgi:uncharacterized protein YndB with AHSA1/START domain
MAGQTKAFTQSEVIPGVTPAQVFKALTDPKQHTEFTGSTATGAARAGCRFTAWDGYISGKHVKLEKHRLIVQEWSTAEWPEGAPPSRVEWSMEEAPGGTRLTLMHSEVPAEQAEAYRKGWIAYYWEPLKEYFAAQAES